MDLQTLAGSPRNERGDGQVWHLLLAKGQFGSQHLCITGRNARRAVSGPVTGSWVKSRCM